MQEAVRNGVAKICSEILGVEIRSDESADFVELGGESMAAELVAARLSDLYNVEISGRHVLRYSKLSELTNYIWSRLSRSV